METSDCSEANMQFVAVPNASMSTTAPGVPGNVTQGLGGLDSAWNVGDTLTANDKTLVGWDPGSGKVNTLADALSYYRHSGQVTGDVTSDFVDALQKSITNAGSYPINPALLMSKGAQQNRLSPETASALFSILSQNSPASA
jgi:hypothetical protein